MNLKQAFVEVIGKKSKKPGSAKAKGVRYTPLMARIATDYFNHCFPNAENEPYNAATKPQLTEFFKKLKTYAEGMALLDDQGVPITVHDDDIVVYHGTTLSPDHVFKFGIPRNTGPIRIEDSKYLGWPADRGHQYTIDAILKERQPNYPDPVTGIPMLHAGRNEGVLSTTMTAREAARHAVKQWFSKNPEEINILSWVIVVVGKYSVNISSDFQWQDQLPDQCNEYELVLPSILPEQVVAAFPVTLGQSPQDATIWDVMINLPIINPNNIKGIKDKEGLDSIIHDPSLKPTEFPYPLTKLATESSFGSLCVQRIAPSQVAPLPIQIIGGSQEAVSPSRFHPLYFASSNGGDDVHAILSHIKEPHLEAKQLCLWPRALNRDDYLATTKHKRSVFYDQKIDCSHTAQRKILMEFFEKIQLLVSVMPFMRSSKSVTDNAVVDAIIEVSIGVNLAELSRHLTQENITYKLNQYMTDSDGARKELIIPAVNIENKYDGNADSIMQLNA